MMKSNTGCRICESPRLQQFVSLGPMPLANAFLRADQLDRQEPVFPLDVYLCENCSLVQLRDVVDPGLMFKEYVYFSSTSESFVAHFRAFASEVFQRFSLGPDSLVIDVGSNDGILLKPFQQLGVRVLGIDPAENVARQATEQGIETLPVFFGKQTAEKIRAARGTASVITANNVFAHINDLDDFVFAVGVLLNEDGVFILEVPYLG
ncbi:MAG TPA: methyltransferase domain-containing protein, partial [Acidobacteriota bacterium]|nr:methyltransferase domain-containing protein [Acidobacteriota bacterium]